jgi:hypothetical protein
MRINYNIIIKDENKETLFELLKSKKILYDSHPYKGDDVADGYSVVDIFLWTEFDFAEIIDLVLKLKTGKTEQFTFRQ